MGRRHAKNFRLGLRQLFLIGVVLMMSWAAKAVEVQEIHSFPSIPTQYSVLVQDSYGAFYGTTPFGGDFGAGTIFRATTKGSIETLVSFGETNGNSPNSPMVLGPDGALYGTTMYGGSNDVGSVFRVTTNGDLTTLASFNFTSTGQYPQSGLIRGNDGTFYGTTVFGGPSINNDGTLFRVTTNGVLTVVASFGNLRGTNQSYVGQIKTLALGIDGFIYGATSFGGSHDAVKIFRANTNGTFSTLASFIDTNGQISEISLIAGSNGVFYGTATSYSPQFDFPSPASSLLFQVGTNGHLTTVAEYTNGLAFNAGLAQTQDGIIFGTVTSYYPATNYLRGAIMRWDTSDESATLIPITNWDVYGPQAGLMLGQDGAPYGTMSVGGDHNYGAIVRVATNGELTAVSSFQYTNGANPNYELEEASDGLYYGTTGDGGTKNFGTLYSIMADGTFKTLVNFNFENGAYPFGGLVVGDDGALYGATGNGGTNGAGTIFKYTTNGILTTLVSFDYTNIGTPVTGLIRANGGSFYCMTAIFYTNDIEGTIFDVSTNGNLKALSSFSGLNNIYPYSFSRLSLGMDGAFYGTTSGGGIYDTGTVFRVNTNGNITTLVSFDGTNGAAPWTALTLGDDGAFYGTTSRGGSDNLGTIFRMTTNGDLTTLYSFNFSYIGGTTQFGGDSYTDLIPDGHGAFYGNADHMFRVTTNGILTWLTPDLNVSGSGSLIHASNGWYYGFGHYPGAESISIYRMNPSVRMLPLTRGGKSWNVHFNGIPGDSYQVQRATTPVGPWETLTNAATDSNGDGHFNDGQPPVERAFYRMKTP
jgi:uncharacterized repeat protein (TIGR03803 family)